MPEPSSPYRPVSFRAFGKPALLIIAFFYGLNCFSPLRLEYDSIKYFSLKDCLENACPPGFIPAGDAHPYGYPLLLVLLSKLGILHAFTIAVVNGVYLAVSLYFIKEIFRVKIPPFLFFLLLLLNWTLIKFFNYPLSEMQYLFFSCGSLFFFNRYTQHDKPGNLFPALVFAGLAILTRTAGIALLPALLAGFAWKNRAALSRHTRRNVTIASILLLFLLGGILFFPEALHLTNYLKSLNGPGPGMGALLKGHFQEWGQLLLNTPIGKIAARFPGADNWLFLPAGLLLFAWFVYGLLLRRTVLPVVITVYLVFYCLLIFQWPFFDPRFWIPILPLIAAVLLQTPFIGKVAGGPSTGPGTPLWSFGLVGKPVFAKPISQLLLSLYIFAGAAAIGYATYTAFHKETLARSQANGIFRHEYNTYFRGRSYDDTLVPVDPYVLQILKKYN